MAFSQTSGGEFERRAFVRCAGGKNALFCQSGHAQVEPSATRAAAGFDAHQISNETASFFGTATFFKRM
jgi:hypothetical protein